MRLWVDDERPPLSEFTTSAQSSAQAITLLEKARAAGARFDLLSLDYDLDGYVGRDTGSNVVDWLVENDYWPGEIRLHTASHEGREAMLAVVRRHAPMSTIIDETDPWDASVFDAPLAPWVDELLRRM